MFLFVELCRRARISSSFEVAANTSSGCGRVSPYLWRKRALFHLVMLAFLLVDDLLLLFFGLPLFLIPHQPISGLLIGLTELLLMLFVDPVFNFPNTVFVEVKRSLILHDGSMKCSFGVFFSHDLLEKLLVKLILVLGLRIVWGNGLLHLIGYVRATMIIHVKTAIISLGIPGGLWKVPEGDRLIIIFVKHIQPIYIHLDLAFDGSRLLQTILLGLESALVPIMRLMTSSGLSLVVLFNIPLVNIIEFVIVAKIICVVKLVEIWVCVLGW